MRILVLSFFLIQMGLAISCDGCNVYTPSGFGSFKNRIGLYARERATFGEYNTFGEIVTRHAGHSDDQNLWGKAVKELYGTYEFRGDFYIKEKWQITVILPYVYNRQKLDNKKRYALNGVGDPAIFQGYNFKTKASSKFNQILGLGLGVKFPLGLTRITVDNSLPNLDLQPGSGAFSGLAYLNYSINKAAWRFETNINYKINGRNESNYKYGQAINTKFEISRQSDLKKASLVYGAGLYGEMVDFDQSTTIHEDTGGSIWFGSFSFSCFAKQFIYSLEYQPAFYQTLNGKGQLYTKSKLNIGVTYIL